MIHSIFLLTSMCLLDIGMCYRSESTGDPNLYLSTVLRENVLYMLSVCHSSRFHYKCRSEFISRDYNCAISLRELRHRRFASSIVIAFPLLLGPPQTAGIAERLGTLWTLRQSLMMYTRSFSNKIAYLAPFRRVSASTCDAYVLLVRMRLLKLRQLSEPKTQNRIKFSPFSCCYRRLMCLLLLGHVHCAKHRRVT